MNIILATFLFNLQLEDKVEKIADLEAEVTEKDLRIDDVMQELETRHMELQAKDNQIECLHDDLNRVSLMFSLTFTTSLGAPWWRRVDLIHVRPSQFILLSCILYFVLL